MKNKKQSSGDVVSCVLPSDYKTELTLLAKAENVSVSELARVILMEHLNKHCVVKTVLDYLSDIVEE